MSPNPLAGVDRILLPLYYQYYSTGGTVLPVLPYRTSTFGFDCMIVFQDEAIFRRVDLASTKIARGIRICAPNIGQAAACRPNARAQHACQLAPRYLTECNRQPCTHA